MKCDFQNIGFDLFIVRYFVVAGSSVFLGQSSDFLLIAFFGENDSLLPNDFHSLPTF